MRSVIPGGKRASPPSHTVKGNAAEDHVRTGVTQGQNHPQSHTGQPPQGQGTAELARPLATGRPPGHTAMATST